MLVARAGLSRLTYVAPVVDHLTLMSQMAPFSPLKALRAGIPHRCPRYPGRPIAEAPLPKEPSTATYFDRRPGGARRSGHNRF